MTDLAQDTCRVGLSLADSRNIGSDFVPHGRAAMNAGPTRDAKSQRVGLSLADSRIIGSDFVPPNGAAVNAGPTRDAKSQRVGLSLADSRNVGSNFVPSDGPAVDAGPACRWRVPLAGALWLLFFGVLACAPFARAAATIEGRVTLPKTRATPVVNQRYEIVAKGGVFSTNPPVAVVYLEGNFPKAANIPVAEITQKDLTFIPSLLPVQVGTRVEFPNLDDTYHNIFSFSPPKRFDLGRYRANEKPIPSVVFDAPGLVTLRCDIHEHMRALVLVLATPHFVVTDAEGRFRLTGLPAGRYTLKAWVDSKTTREAAVELRDDATITVDFGNP